MTERKKKVLLGMSGGVDSSVSAVLLLEAGYEVVGAFMKNWSDCQWREDRRDAMRVAAQLGIEFHTLDFEAAYREKVIKNVFKEYAAGRTPNPDVLCNKYVKFDLFVDAADKLGCEFVATGHYAKVCGVASPPSLGGEWKGWYSKIFKNTPPPLWGTSPRLGEEARLHIPKDQNKDQTYFLSAIPREVLPRVIFPLADLTKPEVREIARVHRLSVAEKKDSVGICFVGEVDIVEFLSAEGGSASGGKWRIPPNPGPIKTTDGRVVGEHEGVAYFTIGQRHGIGVEGGGPPYYVVRKEMETNTLVVGTEVDPELFSKELTAKDLNWLISLEDGSEGRLSPKFGTRLRSRGATDGQAAGSPNLTTIASRSLEVPSDDVPESHGICGVASPPNLSLEAQRAKWDLGGEEKGRYLGEEANCLARIRYRQELQKARVEILDDGRIRVVFDEPQRAVTPGQSVVLYSEDGVVLGGAIIE